MYYAVSHTLAAPIGVSSTAGVPTRRWSISGRSRGPRRERRHRRASCADSDRRWTGLPIWKPPYGRITAFNLNTGEQAWMAANGDGPRNHPLLKDLNLPPLGIPNRAGAAADQDAAVHRRRQRRGHRHAAGRLGHGATKFRAYDKATGAVLWEIELPAGTTGGPMTYMSKGRQFIVVPIGGKDHPAELVALALPDDKTPSSGRKPDMFIRVGDRAMCMHGPARSLARHGSPTSRAAIS